MGAGGWAWLAGRWNTVVRERSERVTSREVLGEDPPRVGGGLGTRLGWLFAGVGVLAGGVAVASNPAEARMAAAQDWSAPLEYWSMAARSEEQEELGFGRLVDLAVAQLEQADSFRAEPAQDTPRP